MKAQGKGYWLGVGVEGGPHRSLSFLLRAENQRQARKAATAQAIAMRAKVGI